MSRILINIRDTTVSPPKSAGQIDYADLCKISPHWIGKPDGEYRPILFLMNGKPLLLSQHRDGMTIGMAFNRDEKTEVLSVAQIISVRTAIWWCIHKLRSVPNEILFLIGTGLPQHRWAEFVGQEYTVGMARGTSAQTLPPYASSPIEKLNAQMVSAANKVGLLGTGGMSATPIEAARAVYNRLVGECDKAPLEVEHMPVRDALEILRKPSQPVGAPPQQKKRGRRKGSLKTDPAKDEKLYNDWKSVGTTIDDFSHRRGEDEIEVRAAIARHKQRRRTKK